MGSASAFALTVAVVALGKWVRGKRFDVNVAIPLAFIGLALAVMQEGNSKFAQQMSVLILVGSLAVYGKDIFDRFNDRPLQGFGAGAKAGATV